MAAVQLSHLMITWLSVRRVCTLDLYSRGSYGDKSHLRFTVVPWVPPLSPPQYVALSSHFSWTASHCDAVNPRRRRSISLWIISSLQSLFRPNEIQWKCCVGSSEQKNDIWRTTCFVRYMQRREGCSQLFFPFVQLSFWRYSIPFSQRPIVNVQTFFS